MQTTTSTPLLDVRSPGEFHQGHIPGAISFPLFSDEERALVGTCYKQKGQDAAVELGLELVGPKLGRFVKEAKVLAPGRNLRVHCWRGGQRSASMAWLFRQAGFTVETLPGGYKTYRQSTLQLFESLPLKLVVLGGRTGSGKTKILQALSNKGEQVIDLEALAHHKGSAFGFIGETEQPTVEQFENDLAAVLKQLDPEKRVWIENESHSIGRVFIPIPFWKKMKVAPLVNIEIPDQHRIANLLDDYTNTNHEDLIVAFHKIQKKLAGLQLKNALSALETHDYATAAGIALQYYDKTYQHCLDVNPSQAITHLQFEHGEADTIAAALIQLETANT
jgi:tRNA 2-selenouridine synthase